MLWNPARLAFVASGAAANFSTASTLSLMFLGARLIVTSIGVAAGLTLWLRHPGAVRFAQLSLVLFTLEAVVRLSTRVGLSSAPPGLRLPLALFIIAHNAGWWVYLQKSSRVRAVYDLESQPPRR
jgi:hypothetical protein